MRIRVNQTSNGHASRYDADVAEDLEKGVLDGFVGVGGVAEVLIRDAERASLMNRDELGEALARFVQVAARDEIADLDGDAVCRRRARRPRLAPRGFGRGSGTGRGRLVHSLETR